MDVIASDSRAAGTRRPEEQAYAPRSDLSFSKGRLRRAQGTSGGVKSRLIILASAAVFFALIAGLMLRSRPGTGATAASSRTTQAPLVEIVPLRPEPYTLVERVQGVIEAQARVPLSFQITGRIATLGPEATKERPKTIDEGSLLRQGDVVAQLEPERFQAQLEAAEALVEQRRADLDRAQAALEEALALAQDAKDEYDRTLAAAERGATTQREVERARLSHQAAAARARSAEAVRDAALATLHAAQAQRDEAKVQLDDATLRAPVTGELAELRVEPGQIVSPGAVVAEMVDDTKVKVRAAVVERRAMRFKLGQRARIRVRALEDQAALARGVELGDIVGEVTMVSPAADPQTGLFRIEITIDNSPEGPGRGLLREGMIAEAEVEIASGVYVLVPEEAATYVDGGPSVYMVRRLAAEGDGEAAWVATLTPIEPVAEDDRYFLLREPPAGEGLIVRGQNLVRDGQPVRVLRDEPRATPAASR